ncbi:MAG: hypothetical protein O3A01_04260 [bacterium]|nr:hypothetical protein [bacterium]
MNRKIAFTLTPTFAIQPEQIDPEQMAILAEVSAAFGIQESPNVLMDNLERKLQQVEFTLPRAERTNLQVTLSNLPIEPRQKKLIMAVLSCIYHDHMNKAEAKGYWENNWGHIIGEVRDLIVLGVSTGRINMQSPGLIPAFAHTLLASALTDCQKDPGLKDVFVHHLNAVELFDKKLAVVAEANGFKPGTIRDGILSHQFAPPFIMMFVLEAIVNGMIAKGADINPATLKSLSSKILAPYQNQNPDKPGELNLTAEELAILKAVDPRFTGWYMPSALPTSSDRSGVDQNALICQEIVIGDAAQYFGDGVPKVVAIRGPETSMQDALLDDSIESILGDGLFSSFGASIAFLAEDEPTKQVFLTLRESARRICDSVKSQIQGQLGEAWPNGVPFLDVPLPKEEKKATYAINADTDEIFNAAKTVRSEFVRLFAAELRRSQASGEYYKALAPKHGPVGLSVSAPSSRRGSFNPEARASLTRTLSGSSLLGEGLGGRQSGGSLDGFLVEEGETGLVLKEDVF